MSIQLLEQFRRCLAVQGGVDAPLDELLKATAARAVGLWRVEDQALVQIGFRAVPDMLREVQSGFAAATMRVPLTEVSLGIVKAAVTGKPAEATLEGQHTGLAASASWLARFQAVQSVAFPILDAAGQVTGVLAVSTARPISRDDATWSLMNALTAGLAPHFCQ